MLSYWHQIKPNVNIMVVPCVSSAITYAKALVYSKITFSLNTSTSEWKTIVHL